MEPSPKAQVLIYYRRQREAGLYPHDAIDQVRAHYANVIAIAVSRGAPPPPAVIECWLAATRYGDSMLVRGRWWWQQQPPPPRKTGRHARPRPSRVHLFRRSTIPT